MTPFQLKYHGIICLCVVFAYYWFINNPFIWSWEMNPSFWRGVLPCNLPRVPRAASYVPKLIDMISSLQRHMARDHTPHTKKHPHLHRRKRRAHQPKKLILVTNHIITPPYNQNGQTGFHHMSALPSDPGRGTWASACLRTPRCGLASSISSLG
jgi:hypothetical protein